MSRPPFEQFFAFRRFGGALDFSADGEHLYFISDITGQFNLWSVAAGGGWPSQLTGFGDRTAAFRGPGAGLTDVKTPLFPAPPP